MKVGVVILAGGSGGRFGADIPKQFIPLNGKPMWKHAYDTFASHPNVGQIVVVFPKEYAPKGMSGIALSGKTRRESSFNGLRALQVLYPECRHVLIHDAARPLVSHSIITDCIRSLESGDDAVDTTIRSPDTIVRVTQGAKRISSVPKRSELRLGQTPQGFRLHEIWEAHERVDQSVEVTDDVGLFIVYCEGTGLHGKYRIGNVEGDERNMKITTQADLIKAERMARTLPDSTIALPKGNALVWGGTGGIGSEVVKLIRDDPCPVTMIWGSEECDMRGRHDRVWKIEQNFLDYLVISVGTFREVEAVDWGAWNEEFQMNFTHVTRFLYNVRARGCMKNGGAIVVVGSSSAYQGRGGYTAYSSAKAALVNFVQGLANEWTDVRINVVNPGRTDTLMRRKMYPNEDRSLLCPPEEVASTIVRVLGSEYTGCVFDVRAQGIGA